MNEKQFSLLCRRQASIKDNLKLRALITQAVRAYFIDNGYLEVDTPVRLVAPAPEAHIDPVESEFLYLQTSPELCMKRLLCAGYDKIFQICKCFRKNERGEKHLPELTLLEWYAVNHTYTDLMDQCEALIKYTARAATHKTTLTYGNSIIHLERPWARMSVAQAFQTYGSMSMEEALAKNSFDEIMGIEIEPKLGFKKPVFIYDYPAEKGALARLKPSDTSLAERFELYIAGVELCNAFTELTDEDEQRSRFTEEMASRNAEKKATPMPEKFLSALEFMPDAAGIALGLDRLIMLLTNSAKIDDITAFTPEEL